MQNEMGTRYFNLPENGETRCRIKWEQDIFSNLQKKGTKCRINWEQDIFNNLLEQGTRCRIKWEQNILVTVGKGELSAG